MPVTPLLIVRGLRNLIGFNRRRNRHRKWQPLPERAVPGSTWWADDPRWFPQSMPPRRDTQVEILIDGQETFRAAWQAIRAAKRSVWLTDWAMNVDMPLIRDGDTHAIPPADGPTGSGYRVFDLLTAAPEGVEVRVLLWSGSRLFRPRAALARKGLRRLMEASPRVRGISDRHIRLTHCHHQKTIVVDGQIAFVGGLDMADFDIDRWDTTAHPVRKGLNWHDLCLRLEGSAARDVGENFVQRWHTATGETLLQSAKISTSAPSYPPIQVIRTIPARTYDFAPDGEYGIAWAYREALRTARSYIYMENQYLWSQAVADELIAALERVKDPTFRVVLVLPARPNIGKGDTDAHIRRLRAADAGRGRVHVFSLYTGESYQDRRNRTRWRYKPIYVHAKTAIVDDAWCTIGSANLNGRGLEGDSELNVQSTDPALARALRLRLWSEHLRLPEAAIATLEPAQAIDRLSAPLAASARAAIEARNGELGVALVPYQIGAMPGDLSAGELEAMVLDR